VDYRNFLRVLHILAETQEYGMIEQKVANLPNSGINGREMYRWTMR
jgi:hypothetical protein